MWLSPKSLSRPERTWIAAFGVVLAALTMLPYLIFWMRTPPEQQYAWSSVFYYDDTFQYYAWARHIAGGDWLIRNYYTENPDATFALFNPFFLAMGWLTRACGNVYFVHHALRVAGVMAFAWISYAFCALFLPTTRSRITAQLLMLGGGLEYVWFYLAPRIGLPLRYATPLADPYTFKVLYRYGHLTCCLCLLLLAVGTYLAEIRPRAEPRSLPAPPSIRLWLAIGVLGLINPYYLVLVGLLLGLDALYRRDLPACILLGLAAAPAALNYALQPVTGHLGAISFDDPIHWGDLLLFFLPVAGLCVGGAGHASDILSALRDSVVKSTAAPASPIHHGVTESTENPQLGQVPLKFLVFWLALVALLVLTPLQFKARMTFGLQVPLAILAAAAWPRLRAWKWLCVALMFIDPIFTFTKESLDIADGTAGRIDRDLLTAFAKLDELAPSGGAAMTTIEAGNFLPAYSNLNVYAGHSFQTEDFYRKEKLVNAFFGAMPPADAVTFLRAHGIEWVLTTPAVHASLPKLGGGPFKLLYQRGDYAIIRVGDNNAAAK